LAVNKNVDKQTQWDEDIKTGLSLRSKYTNEISEKNIQKNIDPERHKCRKTGTT